MDYSVNGASPKFNKVAVVAMARRYWVYAVLAVAVIIIIALSVELHKAHSKTAEAVNATSTLRYIVKETLDNPQRAGSYFASTGQDTQTGLTLGQTAGQVLADPTFACNNGSTSAMDKSAAFSWLSEQAAKDEANETRDAIAQMAETATGTRIKTDAELTRKAMGF